jgi:hypothetical protein
MKIKIYYWTHSIDDLEYKHQQEFNYSEKHNNRYNIKQRL